MERQNFIPISLELLRIDTILGVDLFLKINQGHVLYRSSKVPFNDKVRRNLISHGVSELYISNTDSDKFARYIENNLSGILNDPLVPPEQKRQLVYDSSINIARDLLQNPSSPTAIKRSTNVVKNMVDLHLKDEGGFQKLVELMPRDYDLIHHSANVATYSVALGKALGVSKSDLYELGLGSLLHDVGKSKIPREILYKPGKLTNDEFNVIKEHVFHGMNIAGTNPVIPKNALTPILWHHERLSGAGYPYGKVQDEIPLYGMITGIADSFDAMTTKRIYQDAVSTFKSLEILLSESDSYDSKVVLELIKLLGPEVSLDKLKAKSGIIVVSH